MFIPPKVKQIRLAYHCGKKRQKSKAGSVEMLTLFDSVTTVVVDFDAKKEGIQGRHSFQNTSHTQDEGGWEL